MICLFQFPSEAILRGQPQKYNLPLKISKGLNWCVFFYKGSIWMLLSPLSQKNEMLQSPNGY